jgi:hypothetical protein
MLATLASWISTVWAGAAELAAALGAALGVGAGVDAGAAEAVGGAFEGSRLLSLLGLLSSLQPTDADMMNSVVATMN